jgi:hypothetical protein
MKTGDLVIATRKKIWEREDACNRYLGIFIKEEHDNMYVECFTGGETTALFDTYSWDVEIINENW